MLAFLIVGPVIVFLIFVAPLWLFLHYRSKRKTDSALSSQDLERLQVLSEKAEAMQSELIHWSAS